MDFQKEREYIGNLSQLLRVNSYRMLGGRADGVRAVDVSNGSGLQFTVVADRCMDLSHVSFRGVNLSYINQCGVVSPSYYDPNELNFLRNFTAGFLTTCGLQNIGSPCEDGGKRHGLHGRISNTPAEEFSVRTDDADVPEVTLRGVMQESVLFGEHLTLTREIKTRYGENVLLLHDKITNHGFRPQYFMMLYHFNMGYPFLAPGCSLHIPSVDVVPRDDHAAAHLSEAFEIGEPTLIDEMCYYHRLNLERKTSTAGLFNHKLNIGVTMTFEHHFLDHFTQWKHPGKGEYVLGLEPSTNDLSGVANERKRDVLKTLAPSESMEHTIELAFFDHPDAFEEKLGR